MLRFFLTIVVVIGFWPAVVAQRSLLDELPADGDAGALRGTGFGPEFTPLELPGAGTPRGLARIGKVVWLARGDRLLRLAWPNAKVEVDTAAPAGLLCLCADSRFVYGVAAAGIVVLDPIAGLAVRTIALPERNLEALGCIGERFALATPTRAWLCGPTFAEVGELPAPEVHASWFAANGKELWVGGHTGLATVPLPGDERPAMAWEWPVPLHSCVGTWIDGKLLIAGEPSGKGRAGECIGGLFVPALAVPTGERLSIGCFAATPDVAKYVIGPRPVDSIEKLGKELRRIIADPACRVGRSDGTKGPMPVVIEAHPGVRVAAVKAAWAAAEAAGFDRVHAPALEGYVREQRRKATGK